MGILDKVKSGMETAQNLSRKVGEVRDTFSTRATKIENSDAEEVLKHILIPGENIEQSYQGIRDLLIFTSKRLIIVDIQGLTGKKRSYTSVPYKSIQHFSIRTAGLIDIEAELSLFGSSGFLLCDFAFGKYSPIFEVQQKLAEVIL
jgi:hypothetical protein|nr:MAG TPA: Bacterial PH domain protein [Caudoviricetes sp.]